MPKHRQRLKNTLLALHIGLCCSAGAAAQEPAASVRHRFQIPSQALDSALKAFGAQSGLQLFYPAELVAGKRSSGLIGQFAPEQALQQLIEASGLQYRIRNGNTVTLEKAASHEAESAAPQSETTLPAMTVKGMAEYDSTDPYNPDYSRPNATTATKTNTPLMETPVSVKVISKAVLDDQGVVRVGDALKNVSSVQAGVFNAGFVYDTFVIRGFTQGVDVGATIFRDGARLTGFPLVTAGLDRIEVIKGPSSVLYGRIEPGGLVNAVTKSPLPEAHYSLQQQFGSFDLFRTSLDATGPVPTGKPGELLYRFNADYLDHKSFRDFAAEEQVYLAPKIQWNIGDRTRLNLDFEYRHQDLPTGYDNGVPSIGNRPADIPPSRYLGDPTLESYRRDDYLANLNFTHEFNDDWKIGFRGMYAYRDWQYAEVIPFFLDENTRIMNRLFSTQIEPDITHWWFTSLDLTGRFTTYGIRHTVLAGTDYYRQDESTVFAADYSFPGISIDNPVYGGITPNPDSIEPFIEFSEWNGLYLQDQIDITDRLHLLLGGRYDNTRYAVGGPGAPEENFGRIKPRFGFVYQPQNWLSFYGHYAEALGTSNGVTANNTPIKPQTSTEYELGLKTELFDGRLIGTLAFYDLTKDNILTPDPTNPRFSIPIGQARSQGAEIDITGEVTDKLSLIASYAYTDTEITEDHGGNQGHRLPNAPYNSGSLWAKYKLFDHFTVGAGAFAVGQRQVDNANSAQMPGYVRVDAMAAYDWKLSNSRLIAQINVNNLLDKDYYVGSSFSRSNGITLGFPISALGTLRLEY